MTNESEHFTLEKELKIIELFSLEGGLVGDIIDFYKILCEGEKVDR